MQRTISVMVGKGSVNHNSRKFHAANTDPQRFELNRSYCNDKIQNVYHELFDKALERYNQKQTRSDRCIEDYYEKIRSGKQEKPFHEIILQIGNCGNMSATTENGRLAAKILDEYMETFQSRNPNLRVSSAHLHMDEATPHLHIDFVPFVTGSTRGLDTRVSLKKALAAQGFKGGSRQETEWNQWVHSEKIQLSKIMRRYDIQWEQLGTHEKHLSVLDYEKKERAKEVSVLEDTITNLKSEIDTVKTEADFIEKHAKQYEDDPKWQLPEPGRMMSAKMYHKMIVPLFQQLKGVIKSILAQYFEAVHKLKYYMREADSKISNLKKANLKYQDENMQLKRAENNLNRLRRFLGDEKTKDILQEVTAQEKIQNKKNRNYER